MRGKLDYLICAAAATATVQATNLNSLMAFKNEYAPDGHVVVGLFLTRDYKKRFFDMNQIEES